MDLGLKNRRVAVAAASSGLGFAIAHAVAVEGARVAICSRDLARASAAAEAIATATGAEVVASKCDVAESGATVSWLGGVAEQWGGIDAVVPNAGGPPPGTFRETEPEHWDAAYRLTLRSALEGARAARPLMGSGAALLFMTSMSVRQPAGTLVLSSVFRAGVAALAKYWPMSGQRTG